MTEQTCSINYVAISNRDDFRNNYNVNLSENVHEILVHGIFESWTSNTFHLVKVNDNFKLKFYNKAAIGSNVILFYIDHNNDQFIFKSIQKAIIGATKYILPPKYICFIINSTLRLKKCLTIQQKLSSIATDQFKIDENQIIFLNQNLSLTDKMLHSIQQTISDREYVEQIIPSTNINENTDQNLLFVVNSMIIAKKYKSLILHGIIANGIIHKNDELISFPLNTTLKVLNIKYCNKFTETAGLNAAISIKVNMDKQIWNSITRMRHHIIISRNSKDKWMHISSDIYCKQLTEKFKFSFIFQTVYAKIKISSIRNYKNGLQTGQHIQIVYMGHMYPFMVNQIFMDPSVQNIIEWNTFNNLLIHDYNLNFSDDIIQLIFLFIKSMYEWRLRNILKQNQIGKVILTPLKNIGFSSVYSPYNQFFIMSTDEIIGNGKFIDKENDEIMVFESNILTNDKIKYLMEIIPNFKNYSRTKLIHRGSMHGYSAKEFHTNCDNKTPTITIVLATDGNIFGGYTSIQWNTIPAYTRQYYGGVKDVSSVVFLLRYNGKECRTKLHGISNIIKTRYSCPSWTFGFRLNSKCNTISNNRYLLHESETAHSNFLVKDYEVFQLCN
eukprot:506569_1